jgi:hypothetical protein
LKKKILVVAAVLCSIRTAPLAAATCASDELFRELPVRAEFGRVVKLHYLDPGEVDFATLAPATTAKILGHALTRQARHVGDDFDAEALFECLVAAIERELDDLEQAQGTLLGLDSPSSLRLRAVLGRARLGFHDTDVQTLTGVDGSLVLPSVFEGVAPSWGTTPAPTDEPRPASAQAPTANVADSDAPVPEAKVHPCRFNIPPEMFDRRHRDRDWYLLERPWRDNGFRYDVVQVPSDRAAADPKRPENRLQAGQRVVAKGSKQEVADAIGRARIHCR